jgi:acyl-CoA thioesterase-2
MRSELAELVDILSLEQIELNLFRGTSPTEGWQRVYGGQVLGQALVAASRTVDGDNRSA